MRFAFTPEQDALRAEARRFLGERASPRTQDPALHAAVGALGWLEPDEDVLGFVERCILAEETGRALAPGSFLPSTIAAMAILRCASDEQRERLLPALRDGSARAAYAHDTSKVPGAADAGVVVVRTGSDLLAVAGSALVATPVVTADLTRAAADVRFEGGERLAAPDEASVHVRAAVLVAAESVGVATAALDMAVAYASTRTQFGAPIGTFQAIKHKAAEMLRAIEAARLLTYRAAVAIATVEPTHAVAASMAKIAANDAVMLATKENIQIHGGVGVTWEHDAHLYYRRALANQSWFGETATNRDRVAASLLAEARA